MSTTAKATAAARPMSALERFSTFTHAVAFVAGFTTVFVLLFGLPTFFLAQVMRDFKPLLMLAGGILVIVFGLMTLDVIKAGWFNYDTRMQWAGRNDWGYVSSYLMGVFFAAGWSPCIGATLGAILTLSANQATMGQGALLLLAYSLGLGIPFLLVGLGIDRATRTLRRVQRYMPAVKWVTGVLLILVGLVVLNGAVPDVLRMAGIAVQWPAWLAQISFTRFASLAASSNVFLDPAGDGLVNPTMLLSFAAGLLSFLSPCVLPLVPAYVGYLGGRAVQAAQR